MEYQDQVNIINDIEKNVRVDLISYRGIKIWPVIRLAIWQNIFDGPQSRQSSRKKKSFFKKLTGFLLKRFFIKKNIYRKADAVFLIKPSERTVKIENKYYSPFSNSLQELLKELNISSVTLDLASQLPVYGETYFLDRETAIPSIIYKDEILEWDKLIRYLNTNYPQYIPDKSAIIDYCENMLRHEKIFTRILKQIKPKIAFLVCYYHPAAMGYVMACRNLGIKTVDVQHGDQYGMYRNWNNLPQEGYELLPSSFWCWGQSSADGINKWSGKVHPEHKASVTGNLWVSRFINSAGFSRAANITNVLVALTNKAYPVDNIASAIKESSDTIKWTVRPHPAMPDELKKLESVRNKIVIDDSSLFETLKKNDFIITPCSTAAYEALLFKVRPIITHEEGREKFKSYIDKGLFSYAQTAGEILEILQRNKASFNFKEENPYMETDREIIKNNILNLI